MALYHSPSPSSRVYRPVLGITLWATFVAVVDIIYGQDWGLTNNVVPLVSVVVALLLVFRWVDERGEGAACLALAGLVVCSALGHHATTLRVPVKEPPR